MNSPRIKLWSVIGALMLFLIIVGIHFDSQIEKSVSEEKLPFAVGLHTVFRSTNGHGFWVAYRSMHGDTVGPVDVFLYLAITNMQTVQSTISKIRVEVSCEETRWFLPRRWTGLNRIRSIGNEFFWAWGTDDLKNAIPVVLGAENLETNISMKPLATGIEARGWDAYEIPKQLTITDISACEYRITISDMKGASASIITKGPGGPPTVSQDVISGASLLFTGDARKDLSKCFIKRFSQPPE